MLAGSPSGAAQAVYLVDEDDGGGPLPGPSQTATSPCALIHPLQQQRIVIRIDFVCC